jgi:maltooligosyltrehalose trehalohydrolase
VGAPEATTVEVIRESTSGAIDLGPLTKSANGYFTRVEAGLKAGDLYGYRVDGRGPFPDPAGRFQPQGVHGPSQIVDPSSFVWTDSLWAGVALDRLILYELHVGTFTPEGTFDAARRKLTQLRDLGITAVELMPVADFAGTRNWGYDGVAMFAPARCYGTPDDLRRLIDDAHGLSLAVHLDVVYNHLGPDGAYLGEFSRHYYSQTHRTLWGMGMNFDGENSAPVRDFVIENALHWIHEYHFDGLRLDATHAIVDDGPRYILAELQAVVRLSMASTPRHVVISVEDHRNLVRIITPEPEGWGLDATWSDDFHHEMRRCLVGDNDGYFVDFTGSAADIAETVRKGWFFCGQHSAYFGGFRGSDPERVRPPSFVICLQNHDQVGNRAMGDRLHHEIDLAAFRAATVLLLLAPETPLLFMGQEWAASTPFLYFTDHYPELGRLVTEGRRHEFSRFDSFKRPETPERIPDPQKAGTFISSRLLWTELDTEPHASVLSLHQRLIGLRRNEPALQFPERRWVQVAALDESAVLLRRAGPSPSGDQRAALILAVVRLRESGLVDLTGHPSAELEPPSHWDPVLSTEQEDVAPDGVPLEIDSSGPILNFQRPGAVVFRAEAG